MKLFRRLSRLLRPPRDWVVVANDHRRIDVLPRALVKPEAMVLSRNLSLDQAINQRDRVQRLFNDRRQAA